MKGWADVLVKHVIIPQQQFACTRGKNASDITMVIDAMDLLHSGRFDGFCLVSSDSARIREQGVDVFGLGEQKTPESFRQACRRFVYENPFPGAIKTSRTPRLPTSRCSLPATAVPLIKKVLSQEDGRLGEPGHRRQAAPEPGTGFRPPHLRLPKTQRSYPQDE